MRPIAAPAVLTLTPTPTPTPTPTLTTAQLVQRLYLPGTPTVITAIDDQLKLLQHSPQGWQLADALLASPDQNVRFFAALTFQIKLNNDGTKLDASTAHAVLTRLVSWTVRLERAGEGDLVRKKLCAALGTYFLRSSVPWNRPLLHLAASFQQGDALQDEQLPAAHDALDQFLPLLTESQLIMMLQLCGQLATDATKVDTTTPASAQVHDQMEQLVQDASRLMRSALDRPITPLSGKVKAESLVCFLNWYLRRLVIPLVGLLTDDLLQSEAMDVFRDILESYTSFFQPQHMNVISTVIQEHVQSRLLQGLQDMEPEVLPVAQLVIAHGIANIQQIVEHPEQNSTTLQLIFAILQAPGYPGDEDEVSIHTIEFWNTYIEYVNDVTYPNTSTETQQPWIGQAKATCTNLTALLWQKMKTPEAEVAKEWTDAESEGFKEFRMDASDLMLSIYVFLGSGMLQQLINLALNALQSQNWQDVEAVLFCINTLADNVLEEQAAEDMLLAIFRSPLYRIVGDFSISMPTQARRTAVDTLGAYGQYIERHAEFLPDTLRFLFASLENQGLYLSAAKSIASLCSTCRSSLTGELDGFLAQYNRFAQSETSEPYTNEKVIGAIAAIIQAVTPDQAKAGPLSSLLDIVDGMIASARQFGQQSNPEMANVFGTSAIECLAAIGKNLQSEDDTPIDLYEDQIKPKDQESFWLSQDGLAIQNRILASCQNVRQLLPSSSEVVEGICKVLRSGYAETEPGPFVFPPSYTVAFLKTCSIHTPNVETVLSMTGTLVLQYSRKDQPQVDDVVADIYQHVVTFVQALQDPTKDPGVAQGCIDVFNRMNPRYTHIFLDASGTGESTQLVLNFALKALDGQDLMPKRAACDFWANLVKPPTAPKDEAIRQRLSQAVIAYGPLLTQALMNQITGRGQRSELEQLCEPLKALISTQPASKTWMEAALSQITPANPSADDEAEKRRFVAALLSVRGDTRKTRDLVKNFYASCRGTVVAYSQLR
ncbi:uncharacterized protein MYCFIDRAFT_138085 [Pseudocercospora fijiensis CIRAD86]|uniref:Importin N-terminal domain-containing protein n=1 Tax=Pseudocercospora fijiensis (strain CIRAD86) TaxID=383855 RepID=M3AXN4_PSEFD|nr:uncharacterized protein MYCFIDRAFT_138085 [Pseudocercospora fijiensis CIRAD86]EME81868.1 hypothetical protein MYCFIDRAFT_138085 [Pseudocercospora fijiensis CIRAD86]